MRQFKTIRWLLTMACIVVCLMGVNYAYFAGQINISSQVKTATMNYSFNDMGSTLDIILDTDSTFQLMNLEKGGEYKLTYSLKSDGDNVPLKKIENESIGSITIGLKSMIITKDNMKLDGLSFVNNSIPNSIGTFDCYHTFDGVNGTLTLFKQTDASSFMLEFNKNDLDINDQIKLGIEESLDKEIIIDNTINGSDLDEKVKGEDKSKIDNNLQIIETIETVEEIMERAIINIEAIYGFQIPLDYDQYNANVK